MWPKKTSWIRPLKFDAVDQYLHWIIHWDDQLCQANLVLSESWCQVRHVPICQLMSYPWTPWKVIPCWTLDQLGIARMKRITPGKGPFALRDTYKKEKQNSSAPKHGQHWHRQPSNLTPVKTHQELLRPSLNTTSLQPFLHYRTTPLRNHAVPAGTLRSGTRGVSVIPWEAQRFRSNFAKKTWGFPNFGAPRVLFQMIDKTWEFNRENLMLWTYICVCVNVNKSFDLSYFDITWITGHSWWFWFFAFGLDAGKTGSVSAPGLHNNWSEQNW